MLLKVFEPRYRAMVKRCLERHEPFGVLPADAAVGTLCYISEVYQLDADSGVSILKVTGYRRFSLAEEDNNEAGNNEAGKGATHVPPDSFGLLVASRAAFFEEEPLVDEAEAQELAELHLQAHACLRLHTPEASLLPTTDSSTGEGGGGEGGGGGGGGGGGSPPSAEALVDASFRLAQYLIDHYGVGAGISERRRLEWLAGTATVDRMRDCLDVLLQQVRRGVGGAGGALAAARRAAERGGGDGSGGLPSRRGQGREQE